jgi:hemerythrin-like domain-containing protein
VHAAIEERIVYSALGTEVNGGKGLRQHAEQEHQEVKDAIFQIERIGYGDLGVDEFMHQIMEGVTEHVAEEENEVFPKMRSDLGSARLAELGAELAEMKTQLLPEAEQAGPLIDLTKDQLYELAQDKDIEGRSKMSREELISALRAR